MDLPVDMGHVRELLREHGAVFALVFGSHATGTSDERSDVDLAVWADRGLGVPATNAAAFRSLADATPLDGDRS